ncbi:glycosyltransferase [Pediococcus acidilactici]|uniref:glycosyltransferase n=1 Tax=Pediococcus acidilactici TaxID=1254 RepID=UPI00132582B3|nr:glycosyltransferase [Pediococcus acidilactici]KAF0334025.1 glycosyltransferase [Pediococcus acidilactici]KAF0343773.1 glycosyltransferase [Pediococcus acidilactici]KAF0353592.1 glycosyltransferase [Pediococcus acidilactici]KAF0357929.1 glycosyltransferase [Pediococcus acidilactici]KAF0362091.1 glycosyltransferase [Pediococcus acidilactici]
MKIAVVLNYNNYKQSIDCVNNLIKIGMDKIVLVDNKSTNDSFRVLKQVYFDNEKVFVEQTKTNLGYANGNNFGFRLIERLYGVSKNNIIYVVNPDSFPDSNTVDAVFEFIQKNFDAGAVTTKINGTLKSAWHHLTPITGFMFNSWIFRWITLKLGIREGGMYKDKRSIIPVDIVMGAFFGIRQTILKEIGYFDNNTFLYYEEEILFAKLKRINKQNYLLTKYNFKHIGRGSTELPKLKFKEINDTSRLYLLSNYYGISKSYKMFYRLINRIDNFLIRLLHRA